MFLEKVLNIKMKDLYIYYLYGLGREVLELAKEINAIKKLWKAIGFVDDFENRKQINELEVKRYSKKLIKKESEFVIASGEPVLRNNIYKKLKKDGAKLATLIHPFTHISESTSIQEGCIVLEGARITTNATIGKNVLINNNAVLSHDVKIDSHCVISPNVNVSGNVTIFEGTFIGSGATLKDEIKIGDHTIIGMGSLVLSDMPSKVVAYGIPAKVIHKNTNEFIF